MEEILVILNRLSTSIDRLENKIDITDNRINAMEHKLQLIEFSIQAQGETLKSYGQILGIQNRGLQSLNSRLDIQAQEVQLITTAKLQSIESQMLLDRSRQFQRSNSTVAERLDLIESRLSILEAKNK